MFQPINLALDRYGRFFISDYGENSVKLFDPDDLVNSLDSLTGFNFNEKSFSFPDVTVKLGDESDVEEEVVESLDGTNDETEFSSQLANVFIDDDSSIKITDGTEIFRPGSFTLESDDGGSGTINHGTGALELTFGTAPAEGTALHADYEYYTDVTGEEVDISADGSTLSFTDESLANDNIEVFSFEGKINVLPESTDEDLGVDGDGTKVDFSGDTIELTNTPIEPGTFAANIDVVVDVSGEAVGTGDSDGTTEFTLANAPIVEGSQTVYVDAAEQTEGSENDYTIDPTTGTITFNTAPGDGLAVTADYNYIDICNITDDGSNALQADNYLVSGAIAYDTGAITNLVFGKAPVTGDLLATYNYVVEVTIKDDGAGNLLADNYLDSGSINYTAGTISLEFAAAPQNTDTLTSDYTHKVAVTDEAVTPDPVFDGEVVTVTGTLTETPVVPGTLSVNLEDDSEIFSLVEDYETLVPLVGTAGGTGELNLESGELSLAFNSAPTSDIVISYSYSAGDKLFVSDVFNHVVKVFNAVTLELIDTLGGFGSGDEQFNQPSGMALNANGTELHVVDMMNHRISVWSTSTFNHIKNYGSLGHGENSGLYYPIDILHIGSGVMLVADCGHNRVVKFNANGSESTPYVVKKLDEYVKHEYDASGILSLTTRTFPLISLETDGTNFYISDLYTSNIVKFNSSWVEASTPVAVYGSEVGNVKFPKGMLVLVDEDKMYVTDTMSGEIEEFTLV